MEGNFSENDEEGRPNPDGRPPTSDTTAPTSADDQSVRAALSEPGIVMVNGVAVQVIAGNASGYASEEQEEGANETGDPDRESVSNKNENVDEDDGSDSDNEDGDDDEDGEDGEPEDGDEDQDGTEEAGEVAPTSEPIRNSSNTHNMISIFKKEAQDIQESLINKDTAEEGDGDDMDAPRESVGSSTERRRSTRKRKSTPVYRIVTMNDDPLDDLDDDDVQGKARRGRPKRKQSMMKNEPTVTDDDEYVPSDVDEAQEDDTTASRPHPHRNRIRTPSASRTGDQQTSSRRRVKIKRKNTVSLGAVNMEKWVKLKEELGVTQDYQFSRKILDFIEENLEDFKKTKKPKIKEEPPEETPPSKSYNPHASESSDPFVCIQTNWEVKRWYLELVSHAKRSTSGFLAHVLRLYCKIHGVDLPPDNALFRNDMENEATAGDKMEEICNCDGNNYVAEESHVDTAELEQNMILGLDSNIGLVGTNTGSCGVVQGQSQSNVISGLQGKAQVVQMSIDCLRTGMDETTEGPEDFSTSAEFRQGFADGATGEIPITNSAEQLVRNEDESSLPLKKQKLKNVRFMRRGRQEYGTGHPLGITKDDYILHELPSKDDTKKKYYECALCHKIYKSWSIFAHIRIHKGEKHCCRQCGKHAVEQRSKSTLKKPSKQSTCSYCPFFSTVRSVMKEHMTAKHPDELAAAERFLCEHCGKELRSKASLKDHRRTHTPQIRNKICDLCGKAFTTRRFLRIHINGVHGTKKHICPHEGCGIAFNTRNMVRTHVNRVHLHLKKVKCTYESCSRLFFSRSELQQHIRVYHTKEKLFTCTWEGCGKAFRTPYHVQVHMRIHTDEKPLKCPHCDYRARQRNALNWHLKKHDPNPNKPATVSKPRAPRPPKQKQPLPPLPRHDNYQHDMPQPSHQPRLQAPYQPHHHLSNQYEFSGIPPNPFGPIQVDNNGYTLPYPQQSVFPPGGMQYQSL
ncbi:uncharacterized protein LOC135496953 [Lineus longissimus]|uniref:uncharacterized protein LOC135496953 n=1 Tax=Lineus longissimus TaxID=88925 RepID=UPI002B4D5953